MCIFASSKVTTTCLVTSQMIVELHLHCVLLVVLVVRYGRYGNFGTVTYIILSLEGIYGSMHSLYVHTNHMHLYVDLL